MSAKSGDRSETVLVVDDNLQNREVAEGHLVSAGYSAVLADGGERALALFQEQQPALVLLDVLMPGMDGFETCRRLRRLPGGADTPILFLTALGDLETHRAALDSGADDFLTKPINRTELLIRLRSLMRIKRLSDELKQNYEVIRGQRDQLLRVQRQREELTTLIVHDLKNPLSSILSNAQYLVGNYQGRAGTRRQDRDDDGAALDDVYRASQSMFRMVMNLLDISRSEDGALAPRLAPIDLGGVLDEVCSEMTRRAEDKEQKLSLQIGAGSMMLEADRDLVRRVVENLVDNAYKYSPRRGTICIEAGPASTTEAIEIRVRDEGVGVPAAYRGKIFEKYGRVEDRHGSEVRNSHGLGLVFCQIAVEAHGGRIWVEDNLPRGSCFCVTFPINMSKALPASAAAP
jgi:signal transduction histidine kinase